MKILVIRLGNLTEVLCTTPLLRCLRRQLPEATLHMLTAAEHEHAVKHNPSLHHLHLWYHDIDQHKALQAEGFTHIIDLQNNDTTKALVKSLGIKPLLLPQSFLQKLLKPVGININSDVHLVDQYFNTASRLNISDDGHGLDFFIPKEGETRSSDIPASHHLGFMVLHLHAHITKAEAVLLKEFCSAIAHPFIITGNVHLSNTARFIADADATKLYSASGKFSFDETADLMNKSKLVLTADIGTAQLAAALQRPVVLLHPSSKAGRPYYGKRNEEKKMWALHKLKKQSLSSLVALVQSFLQKGKLP